MNAPPVEPSQRFYARVAGFTYVINYLLFVPGMFGPAWIRGGGTFAEGARRMLAHERLARIELTSLAISWVSIVVLAYALYVTLAPVNRRLAQIALLMELGEAFVGAAGVMLNFATLRLYAADGARGSFSDEQREALISVLRVAAGSRFLIVLLFFSVGSLLFFYLFYRSGYIPRALSGLGVVGSAVSFLGGITGLIFPESGGALQVGWGPIGIAEIATALWLIVAGIRPGSTAAERVRA